MNGPANGLGRSGEIGRAMEDMCAKQQAEYGPLLTNALGVDRSRRDMMIAECVDEVNSSALDIAECEVELARARRRSQAAAAKLRTAVGL